MPVYNAEKYLGRALDSILHQTYKDYEIILVDDGSKDESAQICEDYKKLTNIITIINQKNAGVSVARNKAIDASRGEYLLFVDADDILFPETLHIVAQNLKETNADILRYEYQYIDENGANLYPNYNKNIRKKYVNHKMDVSSFMHNIMIDEYFMCVNCYKKSIVDKYHLRLKEGCTYNEDTLFICRFLTHCNTLIYVPVVLYGYRKYNGAVTTKFTQKNYNDIKSVFYDIQELINNTTNNHLATELKVVAERLGLRLYTNANVFQDTTLEVINFCINDPQLFEWKTFKKIGKLSQPLWKVNLIKQKIINKLFY